MAKDPRRERIAPALAFCSSARRAQETLDRIAPSLGADKRVAIEPELYRAIYASDWADARCSPGAHARASARALYRRANGRFFATSPSAGPQRYGGKPPWPEPSLERTVRVRSDPEKGASMYAANAYRIRFATVDDEAALRRLVQLNRQRTFCGPALVGEIDGTLAAAASLHDGRVIADPFKHTTVLRQVLPMRRRALRTYSRTPSLPERLRESLAPFRARMATA
jgi:hypothetical protein